MNSCQQSRACWPQNIQQCFRQGYWTYVWLVHSLDQCSEKLLEAVKEHTDGKRCASLPPLTCITIWTTSLARWWSNCLQRKYFSKRGKTMRIFVETLRQKKNNASYKDLMGYLPCWLLVRWALAFEPTFSFLFLLTDRSKRCLNKNILVSWKCKEGFHSIGNFHLRDCCFSNPLSHASRIRTQSNIKSFTGDFWCQQSKKHRVWFNSHSMYAQSLTVCAQSFLIRHLETALVSTTDSVSDKCEFVASYSIETSEVNDCFSRVASK